MERKIRNILWFVLSILLPGCVTLKPDSRGLSVPDYNQRVSVTDPHYDNVLTPIGAASIAASTLSAGYAGYNSNLIRLNDGADQTTSKIGNALIGATVGFGTSYLVNRLLGWGKTKPMNNSIDWLRKANKNYAVITSTNDLIVIPKNADEKYQIRSLEDANQFVSVFNNSRYTDEAFKTGIQNLYRNDLPKLISLFPNTTSIATAKDKYVRISPSYSEITLAVSKYPESNLNMEEKFFNLVKTTSDAIDFKTRYPRSNYFEQIVEKLTTTVPRAELPQLIEAYRETKNAEEAIIYYIITSQTVDEFFNSINQYKNQKFAIYEAADKSSFEEARKTKNSLLNVKTILGETNYSRLEASLAEETMENVLNLITTKEGFKNYINLISNDPWLQVYASQFVEKANIEINKILKSELDAERRRNFEIANQGKMTDFVQFVHTYPGTEEANELLRTINRYTRTNVKQSIPAFIHVAKGDRSFWTTWAESMRDVVKGAENYNIFILGALQNTSDTKLSIHIKATLHLVKTTRLSIFSGKSTEDLTGDFYMELNPGDDLPYACIFSNISGGTTVGPNLLFSAGSSTDFAKEPITLDIEYNMESVSSEKLNEQSALIKNLKKIGNIETKDWGTNHSSVSQLINSTGIGECALNIVYNSDSTEPQLDVYNSESRLVESKKWNSSGRNITTFYLTKGNYQIEVEKCKSRFPVNINVNKMSLTIYEDCTSTEYRENE
jgi:hypothetical protein